MHTWPGFIWYLFSNQNIIDSYGKEYIWKFVPDKWRLWWSDSLGLRIDNPKPFFHDIYTEIDEWNMLISSNTLPNLRDACNKYLIPRILCPYGCSAFIHRCGKISIDLIFQRYLPKVQFNKYISNKKYLSHVESTRDDFLRPNDDYDKWLLNEKWMILPSISFINNVPYVLTCDDHDKGSNMHMIHPPRVPLHNLPSKYSDQLCHCCIRSRTIKPMKSSHFSTGYQMHEQRGCFNGVDTCNLTSYRNFDFRSKLLRDNEARSITNRPDINALLSSMVEEKSISQVLANDKRSFASSVLENLDYDQYTDGATYVPLEYTIIMKRDLLNSGGIIKATIDNRGVDNQGNPLPDIQIMYPKYWPSILYPCQKVNTFGARIISNPNFSSTKVLSSKLCLCWTLSALLLSCQELWSIISSQQMKTSSWYGWMLVYLTRNCNLGNGRRANKKEVFKYLQYINTIEKFSSKINIESLHAAFSGIGEIYYANLINNNAGNDLIQYISSIIPIEIMNDIQILIIDSFYINIERAIENEIIIHETSFELRVVTMTHIEHLASQKWEGEVYVRHGKHHSSWWFQKRRDHMYRHVSSPNATNLTADIPYVLLYVKKNSFNIENAKREFLKYLGGQSHVKCCNHGYFLVKSYDKKMKCSNCGQTDEYNRCPNLLCQICLCKSCFNSYSEDDVHLIGGVSETDSNAAANENNGGINRSLDEDNRR